jgi:hypothetical protein
VYATRTAVVRSLRQMGLPIAEARIRKALGQEKLCRKRKELRRWDCGKRWRAHHNWCGRRQQITQVFAEIAERGHPTARQDRRKPGVERRNAVRERKNSSKILLTEFGNSHDTPVAPVTAFQ